MKTEHFAFVQQLEKKRQQHINNVAGKSVKPTPNKPKISVTQTGIYTDSYLASVPASLERVCRIRTSIIIPLLLETHGTGQQKGSIKIAGAKVKLTSPTVNDIVNIMRNANLEELACACCGLVSKYAYVERHIGKKGTKAITHSLCFYGVDSSGREQRMTIDHIDALSGGGRNILSNKQIMCQPCNAIKSSIPNDVFLRNRKAINNLIASSAD